MAVAHVQSNGTYSATAGTTRAQTFGSNVTAGNLIVVMVAWLSNTATCAVTDNLGNSYTAIGSPTSGFGSTVRMQMFYARNVTGGSCTVTATISASVNDKCIWVHEYSGADTTAPLDGNNGSSGSSAAPATSVTTGSNNSMLVGATYVANTSAAGSGFTGRVNATGNQSEDRILASAGALSVAFTHSPSGQWIAVGAGFKAAAGGTTSVSGSDTGTGTDATSALSVTGSGSDTSSGTETGTASVTGSSTDSAAGTDTGSASVTGSSSDTGTGTDSGTASASGSGGETGSGSDTGAISATVAGSDSGAGSEDGTVEDITGTTVLDGADEGAGSESGTVVDLTPPPEPEPEPEPGLGGDLGDVSTVDVRRRAGADYGTGFELSSLVDLTPAPERRERPVRRVERARVLSDWDGGLGAETGRVVVWTSGADVGAAHEAGDMFDVTAEEEDEAFVLRLLGVDL